MRKVIYTVIVGGYDNIRSLPSFPGWDFVLITDVKPSLWRRILNRYRWKFRIFDNPNLDLTRYSRLPKLKPHLFFPDYDYSIYIDGNARFEADPIGLLEELDWPDFAVSEHPFRNNLYDEFSECVRLRYDDPDTFERQKRKYLMEGLSDPAPLYENNLILRRHNYPNVRELGDAWFEELLAESKRDQLALPYVCWIRKFSPTTFPQSLKRKYFKTRSHHRTLSARLVRSIEKRIKGKRSRR